MLDPALCTALLGRLKLGGYTPEVLDKAVREACLVEARAPRYPDASAVAEVILGPRTFHVHFKGERIVGVTNPV